MHVRFTGDSKLTLGVNVCSWLFVSFVTVMDWRPVQGVTLLSSNNSWDRLRSPRGPELD